MTQHPQPALVAGYATGGAGLDDATIWAIEAHLETCAGCRAVLARAVDGDTQELLDRVAVGIGAGIAAGPGPAPRRRWQLRRTAFAVRMLPWLAMAVSLVVAAVALDLAVDRAFDRVPSVVLLLAPVVPLLPVAAVWSRRTDPAWELMVSAPRSGLWMLLRRTMAALVAVLPVLAVAGWATGNSPALWLLPCLAFTAGSLALGGLIGVDRAAVVLAAVWAAGVVVPSLVLDRLPVLLTGGSWPIWAALTCVLSALVPIRAADHRHPRVGAS
ncbi:zf-HC2 domain-containing protein [Virgisporangium ochraceum]|uniref:Membrane protein n=1 Tax=Virgisporangium ochraceum TaxID=65505 RepID=A0A8J4A0N0_9ACTN|nr:zf-HC2 domain-containing protein [Virgisporangium ochraceum]GIJ73577.1 membrane protein [Virgisporangium ochraceum]